MPFRPALLPGPLPALNLWQLPLTDNLSWSAQTLYEFGYDIGGMERSRYFGMSKDLYHFDHFLGEHLAGTMLIRSVLMC